MTDLSGRSPDYCQGYFEARKEFLDILEKWQDKYGIYAKNCFNKGKIREVNFNMIEELKQQLERGGKE